MRHPQGRVIWACCLIMTLMGCESAVSQEANQQEKDIKDNKVDLTTDMQKGSYVVGYSQSMQVLSQTQGVMDTDTFLAGVIDAVNRAESQVPEAQLQASINTVRSAVEAKVVAAQEAADSAAAAFRTEFAAEEGVVTLPSGLMYQVLTAAEGPKPTATDTVSTHYHGTLTDGTVFDSSVQRNTPASFPVNGVISGWTEALQLMSVGSKWKLVIPHELAYGEQGRPPSIPPRSTLVFEVELLSIEGASE